MTPTGCASSIVVGVDGSTAAINTARWAVDEAVGRDIPLRLVRVVPTRDAACSVGRDNRATDNAEAALHAARDALRAFGGQVEIVESICRGDVEAELLREARQAAMICVGSVGIGHAANWLLGSTAATLARRARCPVAIIRSDGQRCAERQIAVVVDRHTDSDDVVHHAFEEARLRQASILALGVWRWNLGSISAGELQRRLAHWMAHYREIAVEMRITGTATEYLVTHNKSVQLLVTGDADASQLSRLLGPGGHSLASYPNCSILLVRHGAHGRHRLSDHAARAMR